MKFALSFLLQILWTTSFSQSLPFDVSQSSHFQRTNLVVRWKAPAHPWPKTMWIFRRVPTRFSSSVISNLMAVGSFTEKDRKTDDDTNEIVFSPVGGGGVLLMRFAEGQIYYFAPRCFGPADASPNLPGTNQVFQLTTNFLPKLGVLLSEIPQAKPGRCEISCTEVASEFFTNSIQTRTAWFYRAIDGTECDSDLGAGRIEFAGHGRIIGIMLQWPGLKREKSYTTATPDQIIQWIREGKAILPRWFYDSHGDEIPIDWPAVKEVTIKKARAYYWGEFFLGEREHRPIFPSPVIPYAVLQATVDTGATNIDIRINCPIIDETRPLKTGP